MVDIRLPTITGATEREQLAQIKSYLYQLAGQLQFALSTIDTSASGGQTMPVIVPISPSTSAGQASFAYVAKSGFPIEEGTDGIWSYRKWHSGTAECWGLYPIAGAEVTTAWGNLYETAVNYQLRFPTGLFADTPVAHYFAQTSNGGGCLALKTVGETTKDETCGLFPTGATPQTVDLTIAIRAIGRWK